MICHNKNPTVEHNKNKPMYGMSAPDSDKKIWDFEAKEWVADNHTV